MKTKVAPLFTHLLITTGMLLACAINATAQSGGQISGKISDRTAGTLAGVKVTLKNLATQTELTATTDKDGHYEFDGVAIGLYRLRVEQAGFSTAARNVTLDDAGAKLEANFDLSPGSITEQVSVTAARGDRDTLEVPVRTEAIGSEELQRQNNTTTQDSLAKTANVTVVGNGPFQQRPRLRGLDSSRILIMVDGERLNTSRVATDRAGVEIGLTDPSNLQSVEVISGSGSVLYGTDALSGTINFITNQPQPSKDKLRVSAGFNAFYSSNEEGRRGTAEWGLSGKRFAFRFSGMLERYANYHAGEAAEATAAYINRVTVFSTTPAAALVPPRGFVTQQIFGGVFADNFNAPFTRTTSEIPNSNSHGNSFNSVGRLFFTDNDVLRISWNRRRNDNIGFADFRPPIFFQTLSTPFSNLDKYGLRYQKSGITPWFTGLSINAYHQVQDRALRNDFSAYGISGPPQRGAETITRVDVLSDTRQNVKSYGYDIQTNFLIRGRDILTAGTSFFRDHSRDSRVSRTRVTLLGAALVPPAPPLFIPIGVTVADTTSFPQRVPKSNFDNYGAFVQNELDVTKRFRLIGGLRVDRFNVATLPTPGYNPVL
ncbi:MAG: TonB-dependent receptor, partial [Acidobacteria bacterium]|nr:TonB-dependent receptor [Acidobacteriota bacterium]